MTREEIVAGIDNLGPWFHCIDLGNGIQTKHASETGEPADHPRGTWEVVQRFLPKDLTGRQVLDVGCNAGFFSIEAKRRGAARVLGVDAQRREIRQALFVRRVLGLDVEFRRASVYDLDPAVHGRFDIVLALGLIYHCKHIILALEKLCQVTRNTLILETAVLPPDVLPGTISHPVAGPGAKLHPLAYTANPPEHLEYVYNWFFPSVEAARAMLLDAGFGEVDAFPDHNARAVLVCRKKESHADSHDPTQLAANLTLIEAPTRAAPGEELRFTVMCRNTGRARWLAEGDRKGNRGAVRLAIHLLRDTEEEVNWYYAGTVLPRDVKPGESLAIGLSCNAPAEPGRYWIEFDMVSEHVTWFEEVGSPIVRHGIVVG
jgi:tRNA (mo5U34)-methyltransferase